MPFIHFTVAVEYKPSKRINLNKIADQIEASLVRHAETVAVQRAFDAQDPKTKTRVLPVKEQPEMRENYGWHVHDNDTCCSPCGGALYNLVHPETL